MTLVPEKLMTAMVLSLHMLSLYFKQQSNFDLLAGGFFYQYMIQNL